jgi:hypothetical protein
MTSTDTLFAQASLLMPAASSSQDQLIPETRA